MFDIISLIAAELEKPKIGISSKGLDFSHLIELKKIYITEIYMQKQYKSSRIKNHKIIKKK